MQRQLGMAMKPTASGCQERSPPRPWSQLWLSSCKVTLVCSCPSCGEIVSPSPLCLPDHSPEPSTRGLLSKGQVRAQSQAQGSCIGAMLAGRPAAHPMPPCSGGLQRPGVKRTQKARVPVKALLLSLTTQTIAPNIPLSDNYVRCHFIPSMSL